ncbi:hypothetical protein JB92DRAFT_3120465 [Gautieria morchelliformis]|nr:hypothetical protein JB92DRAFT_3120465 [Gautieria morchelliformis]
MVFANLTYEDKEAFFALLDEYFAARPELADALRLHPHGSSTPSASTNPNPNPNSNATSGAAAAAAAHRALASNPHVASAAVSAGLRSVPKGSPFSKAAANPEVANAVGRVAAASLAFSGGNATASAPRPPPRRSVSSSSSSAADAPPPRAPLRTKPPLSTPGEGATRNNDAAPPAPPARARLPPPPRRGAAAPPRPRTPTPEPEEEEPEPEFAGEWAEALYDYTSTDPHDLPLSAGQRVLVTARTSDEWWTGEAEGSSGLFPAAYVKLL